METLQVKKKKLI